jgi:cyclase
MLKKRIIPIQLLMEGRLVKTRRFSDWRDVGDPVKSSAVYNSQYADELIFLNISRQSRSIDDLKRVIAEVSKV